MRPTCTTRCYSHSRSPKEREGETEHEQLAGGNSHLRMRGARTDRRSTWKDRMHQIVSRSIEAQVLRQAGQTDRLASGSTREERQLCGLFRDSLVYLAVMADALQSALPSRCRWRAAAGDTRCTSIH